MKLPTMCRYAHIQLFKQSIIEGNKTDKDTSRSNGKHQTSRESHTSKRSKDLLGDE